MKTSCIVSFGRNALTLKDKAGISPTAGSQNTSFGLFSENGLQTWQVVTKPYATYEPDFWLLDGSYKFVPTTNIDAGFISAEMSGADGSFPGSIPTIAIGFAEVQSTTGGLTFYFSDSGDYIDDLRITFLDASAAVIRTDTYNPTGPVFSTNQAVANFQGISIVLHDTGKPYRYARLKVIHFDTLTTFTGTEIKSATLVEQIDPSGLELPFNTLNLSLISSESGFSIIEPSGFYADLKQNEPLELSENIGDDVVFLGRYYLDSWESTGEHEATFHAMDAIGILDEVKWLGGFYDIAGLFVGTVEEILNDFDISTDIDTEWSFYDLYGWIPIKSHRDGLHDALWNVFDGTSQAVATAARSVSVRVLRLYLDPDYLPDPDHTITSADEGLGSVLSLRPLVTDIEVIGTDWASGATSTLINAPLPVGTHKIIVDDPPWDGYVVEIGSATISAAGGNYLTLVVSSAGTIEVSAQQVLLQVSKLARATDTSLDPTTKPNIINVSQTWTLPVDRSQGKADLLLEYFKQRYKLEVTLFATRAAVGDSVLIDVQGGRQLAGYIVRMETDLTGGFVSKTEIIGTIVPEA